jgi:uncharacterized protein (DUF2141 family)
MKHNLILITVLLLTSTGLFAQSALEVTVNGIKEIKGSIRVGLFNDNEENFLKTPVVGKIVKTTARSMKVIFESVPAGTYAASVIIDENENGELDSGFMGIPKEGFGFSNDVMGMFGPPKFKEASFQTPATKTVIITVKYM